MKYDVRFTARQDLGESTARSQAFGINRTLVSSKSFECSYGLKIYPPCYLTFTRLDSVEGILLFCICMNTWFVLPPPQRQLALYGSISKKD